MPATKPVPTLPPGALQEPGFADFLMFAAGEKDILAAIDQEYGTDFGKITRPSPIEQMIDDATGHGEDVAKTFAAIVYHECWAGEPDEAELTGRS